MSFWLFCLTYGITQVLSLPVREVELNKKNWQLKNQNESIIIAGNITLPSGVYSAYAKSLSLSPDSVLLSKNDVDMRWIATDNWTYYLDFNVDNEDIKNSQFINLTFHGIDTISTISLNGMEFAKTDNMFVRYSYNIKDLLRRSEVNRLEISITSPIYAANNSAAQNLFTPPVCPNNRYHGECHMNFLRKMQASFSWDWGLAAPSMGIWKSVTLEFHDIALIRDVDVTVSKDKAGDWDLGIKVYLDTSIPKDYYGNLTFYAVELSSSPVVLPFNKEPIKHPVIKFHHIIPKEDVELWWPNGYGKQKLYHLHFTFNAFLVPEETNPTQLAVSQKSIRIGFRTIELIQEPITNGESFYFRVNDVPIFMKGTNYIPSHILPELGQNQKRIKHLLESVKYSHMNMIRVWGGGVYESDYFYDMADSLGILIWQDMMFGCAMYPTHPEFLESVREETIQNAKRIGHHASIAIIAANNENEVALVQNWYGTASDYERFAEEYRQLYGAIVHELNIISHSSRPEPLTSSPSNGKKTNSEKFISANPQDPNYGDIHFYEYFKDGWDPKIYPTPRFSSEYGFQSFPAMASWQKVMGDNDDLLDLMDHRQHFPLGNAPLIASIFRHLPLPFPDADDYPVALIYFSQVSQAMTVKIETEVYRKNRNTEHNTMGALYWQLNDVWVAPSWSSIDFFGNYKILHYWTKEFMAPISIIAHDKPTSNSSEIEIFIVRDTLGNNILDLQITHNIYMWDDFFPRQQTTTQVQVEPNTAKLAQTINSDSLLVKQFTKNNCYYEFLLKDKSDNIISKTYYFPDKIKKAVGIKNPNIKVEISSRTYQEPITSISFSITVDYPAVFVYIEVQHENVIHYTLSQNGFMQLEPIRIIHLEFRASDPVDINESHIKVMTVNQFMESRNPIV